MNFQYEWLQEIVVHTEKGNILRLHLSNVTNLFRLYGEYHESTTKKWWLVDFPSERTGDSTKLFKDCLENFCISLAQKNDKITLLENPCNAPFISVVEQQKIVKQMGITATVTVN